MRRTGEDDSRIECGFFAGGRKGNRCRNAAESMVYKHSQGNLSMDYEAVR